MWVVLPLPTLSSYPLSLGMHRLYWPSSWKSKEGKGGARPGSRDGVVRFGNQEGACSASSVFGGNPSCRHRSAPTWLWEPYLLIILNKSHSRPGCLLYSLPPAQEGVLSSPSGTCRSFSPAQGSLQSRTIFLSVLTYYFLFTNDIRLGQN